MEKIASFTVNHLKLQSGLYVSRKDHFKDVTITTFDLRLTAPNKEPVMNTAPVHTIEHLGATFLRNDPEWKERTVYFGPMGCRTGFYMVLEGDLESEDVLPLVRKLFHFIETWEGPIPGAAARDCGNYLDQNLDMAKWYARRYLEALKEPQLTYPQ